jgi:hypothetical protein
MPSTASQTSLAGSRPGSRRWLSLHGSRFSAPGSRLPAPSSGLSTPGSPLPAPGSPTLVIPTQL